MERNLETVTVHDVEAFMNELRGMARSLLAHETDGQSIQATALVHSAFLHVLPKGVDCQDITWVNRAYFFGAMYKAMRRKLIDHARKRRRRNRNMVRLTQPHLENLMHTVQKQPDMVEAIVLELERLDTENPQFAAVIQHRYFSGYGRKEIASAMGISERTVGRLLADALGLLASRLRSNEDEADRSQANGR